MQLSDLKPDTRNANKGTLRGRKMVAESLKSYGAGRSILIDRDGNIIAGNKTAEGAAALGLEDMIVVPSDGTKLVAVQRTDLGIHDKKARELAIADNRASEVGLEWDAKVLEEFGAEDVDLSPFWDEKELVQFWAGTSTEAETEPASILDEYQAKWNTARGQLWRIGDHRLLCDDSQIPENRERLLGEERPSLLHTDPPYGISIVAVKSGQVEGSKPFGRVNGHNRHNSTGVFDRGSVQRGPKSRNQIIQSNTYPVIHGDDKPFDPAWLLGQARATVLWGANYYADKLPVSSCWLVWDKREDITRNSFADGELAWCSEAMPTRIFHHLWNGLHKGSQHGERRTHPTEKPVALFEEIGRLLAPQGGVWFDPYAGSGAQFLAAQNCHARCYGCEIEPLYVAATLERLERAGLTPKLADA